MLTNDDLDAFAATPVPLRGRFTNAHDALKYIRAGRATITLYSKRTSAHYTYRISTPTDCDTGKPVSDGTLMVALLNGPDNTADYKWLGRISRDILWIGRKHPKPGDIARDAPSAKAIAWVWRALMANVAELPEQLEIWHEGCCGRCGRKLTRPDSVARGFGPECAGKI